MKIDGQFWNAYFEQALHMWESGRAQEILRAIPGRQAQRCIAALHDCTLAERPVIHRLMVARFKSSVCGGPFKPDPAHEALLYQFDARRLQPLPQESGIANRKSARAVRKAVKTAFSEAAQRVFGTPTRGEAGEREYVIGLTSRISWRPVLSFGSSTTQATYWASLGNREPSHVALNVLSQIGVSGSTDWDLISSLEEANRSALDAEAIWSVEVARMRELILEHDGVDV